MLANLTGREWDKARIVSYENKRRTRGKLNYPKTNKLRTAKSAQPRTIKKSKRRREGFGNVKCFDSKNGKSQSYE